MFNATVERDVELTTIMTIKNIGKGGSRRMDPKVSRDVADLDPGDHKAAFVVPTSKIMGNCGCHEWGDDPVVQIPTTSNRLIWRGGVSEISNEYLIAAVGQRVWTERDDVVNGLDGITVPDQLDVDRGKWGEAGDLVVPVFDQAFVCSARFGEPSEPMESLSLLEAREE